MSFFYLRQNTQNVNPARATVSKTLSHNQPFFSCRFDPSGRYVFAGGQDFAIQRWDLTNDRKTSLTGHRSWVRGMAFVHNCDGNEMVTADYHGKLIWWPVADVNPTPIRTVDAHDGWCRGVAVSPDNRYIATCGNDELVKIWTVDGTLVRTLRGHNCHVYKVAFHPRGTHLVSGDLRGNVKQWEYATGREVRTLDATVLAKYDRTFRATIGGTRSIAFNNDGTLLACAGITDVTNAFAGVGKPAVVLFNWENGQRRHLLRPRQSFRGTAWGVDFHSSGFLACAGGGSGGRMWFWRTDNAQSFADVRLPNLARDLHIHPDGRQMAVAFYDNKVRIYTMPNA
ncbi:MAG: WD40 repeat domain-containing protein [Gemmataceae bacterium]